ncbi:gp58-like family protein [Companilactobacillus nodensis]|uniref:gp58-like family protein n=1 Tax=Companilactobacillus nodensis TaxID=460870 RepID=UPI0004690EF9|nr:gp58-like family protein [Companilactobacillus nodensis]
MATLVTSWSPTSSVQATVGDVGFLNLGETVTIVRYDLDIKYQTRVTGIKWNRKNENHSTITIGDKLVMSTAERLSGISSSVKQAQVTANDAKSSAGFAVNNGGVNVNWSEDEPQHPKEGDLWYQTQADGTIVMKQYEDGQWLIRVDDTTGEQIKNKVDEAIKGADAAKKSADDAVAKAEEASSNAKVTAAKFDDTNQKVKQALDNSVSAQSSAVSAVAKAESTASEFGTVKQKADSAAANALSAQASASEAVTQALSAEADSKDAKQIAGAVNQSYKTLTDGSTMTIAELEGGLAVKLTKTDLNGYSTKDWTQNQLKVTADGINGTMSSIKNTVDSQTTSIHDLQADSSGFKTQFTTVNDTLGKQTTDIGTLQASSKELTTGFNTLTTDNGTNKNDISQLKQTATEVSSTLETVQTQVQNSAVGTNLIVQSDLKSGYLIRKNGGINFSSDDFHSDNYIATNGATVFTLSSPDYVFKGSVNHTLAMYDSDKSFLGWQSITSSTQTLSHSNAAYIRFSINFTDEGDVRGKLSDWLSTHRYKLEKGSVATDWCANPADNATVTAVSKISQTVDGMQTDISKKIEQKDLNGYATQDWSNNQIKITADGINGAISSIKNTVDSQTTSINDLKADSNGFRDQFTTVTNTLGTHTTDISTLQVSSKELTSGFNTLTTDNSTNKNDISQLKQTATEVSSTLETVQTQVQDSAVGTNLLTGTSNAQDYTLSGSGWELGSLSSNGTNASIPCTPGASYTYSVIVKSTTYDCYPELQFFDSGKNFILNSTNVPGKDIGMRKTTEVAPENAAFVGAHMVLNNAPDSQTVVFNSEKLEKGSLATDWCPNPADNATVTAVSSISQTIDKIQGTIINKADQSQITQLANQITTTITSANNPAGIVKEYVLKRWFDDGQTGGWHGKIVGANKDDTYQINAGNGHTAVLTFVDTSVVESKNSFAVSANEEFNFEIWIDTTLTEGDIQFGLQLTDSSGKSSFFPAITVDKNIKAAKYTGKLTIPNGYVSAMPAITKSAEASLIDWGLVTGMSITNAADTGSGSSTQVTQLSDAFGLLVRKDNLLSQINVEAGSTLIHSNKIFLDADSVIFSGSAFIPSAAITNLSADKITAGTLDAKTINVINLNGSSIASKSITADKLATNMIRVGLNNELSGMVINQSSLATYDGGQISMQLTSDGLLVSNPDNYGSLVGRIHSNTWVGHSNVQGLNFDLEYLSDYMSWSRKRSPSETSYTTVLRWMDSGAASTVGVDAGFLFSDDVRFQNPAVFRDELNVNDHIFFSNTSNNVKIYGASTPLKFSTLTVTGEESNMPSIKNSSASSGLAFGSGELWLSSGNNAISLSDIKRVVYFFKGKTLSFATGFNKSGGTAVSWHDYTF